MPIEVDERGSPGWWRKRLFFQLNDRERRQRLWKLHNYYAGSPPLPEGAEPARESFEAFQRHSRSNFAELITSAVSERMTPVGFRTARDSDVNGAAEAAAVWERWRRNARRPGDGHEPGSPSRAPDSRSSRVGRTPVTAA